MYVRSLSSTNNYFSFQIGTFQQAFKYNILRYIFHAFFSSPLSQIAARKTKLNSTRQFFEQQQQQKRTKFANLATQNLGPGQSIFSEIFKQNSHLPFSSEKKFFSRFFSHRKLSRLSLLQGNKIKSLNFRVCLFV